MSKEEQLIRSAYDRGVLFFSDHAYDKMKKIKKTQSQVVECIKNGILVEQQNGYGTENPRMVFYNGHSDSFYVVVTFASVDHVVITVCETNFMKWKKKGDGIERIN